MEIGTQAFFAFKNMMRYYPLASGNKWEYRQKNGNTYTNEVLECNGDLVTLKNSTQPEATRVRIANGVMYNELINKDNFQKWLADDLNAGETWEVSYQVNGLDSYLIFTLQETAIQKEVEGKKYENVISLKAESKIKMNNNLMSLNYFTTYFYAPGVGLIATESSDGDFHNLIACVINE